MQYGLQKYYKLQNSTVSDKKMEFLRTAVQHCCLQSSKTEVCCLQNFAKTNFCFVNLKKGQLQILTDYSCPQLPKAHPSPILLNTFTAKE